MLNEDIKSIALKANLIAINKGITQESISMATGHSQSQVSRILSGVSKRRSKAFIDICNYVYIGDTGISKDLIRENDLLLEALASVWDGSNSHAEALAAVIRSLGVLTATGNSKVKIGKK